MCLTKLNLLTVFQLSKAFFSYMKQRQQIQGEVSATLMELQTFIKFQHKQ